MSAENSWSRNTVRPSFRLSWNQSRQVTRLPVQLWKYSCPTTDSILAKSTSVAVSALASTYFVLKMFRPLFSIAPMLKSPTATIMKRSRSSSRPKRCSSQRMAWMSESIAWRVLPRSCGSTQTCSSFSLPEADRMRASMHSSVPATSANRYDGFLNGSCQTASWRPSGRSRWETRLPLDSSTG